MQIIYNHVKYLKSIAIGKLYGDLIQQISNGKSFHVNYLATKLVERYLFSSRYVGCIAIPVAPFTPWQEKVTKEIYHPSLNTHYSKYTFSK